MNDHLEHREQQRLFAALVAQKEVRRKGAIPHLGDEHLERTDAGSQAARTCPITIAGPLVGTFMRLRLQVLGHLRLEHLVEQMLQKCCQLLVFAKEGL